MFFFMGRFTVRLAHGLLEFLESFLLLFTEFFRYLDYQSYIMVASGILAPQERNALSLQPDPGIGLRSRRYIVGHFSVHSLNSNLDAKGCRCKGDRKDVYKRQTRQSYRF